jgi:hypothetical protein
VGRCLGLPRLPALRVRNEVLLMMARLVGLERADIPQRGKPAPPTQRHLDFVRDAERLSHVEGPDTGGNGRSAGRCDTRGSGRPK